MGQGREGIAMNRLILVGWLVFGAFLLAFWLWRRIVEARHLAYENGRRDGWTDGKAFGYKSGFADGYKKGSEDTKEAHAKLLSERAMRGAETRKANRASAAYTPTEIRDGFGSADE